MKLILNADDFGMSRGVNFGIQDAFQKGVVRSTSLIANGKAFAHAIQVARENPGLGVGIHLCLTMGRPLSTGCGTLTDEQGNFHCLSTLMDHLEEINPADVEREYTAQIEKALSAGLTPTHLDSHHHVHLLAPILPVFEQLTKQYGLPARMRADDPDAPQCSSILCPDHFSDQFYGGELTEQTLIDLITPYANTPEVVEIMTHPAYLDECLLTHSSYTLPRARELAILCSDAVRECVRRHGIELTNYRHFHNFREKAS